MRLLSLRLGGRWACSAQRIWSVRWALSSRGPAGRARVGRGQGGPGPAVCAVRVSAPCSGSALSYPRPQTCGWSFTGDGAAVTAGHNLTTGEAERRDQPGWPAAV